MTTCKLCGDGNKKKEIFRSVGITGRLEEGFDIAFLWGDKPAEEKRFKYCPECGRKLTENDFKAWYEKD